MTYCGKWNLIPKASFHVPFIVCLILCDGWSRNQEVMIGILSIDVSRHMCVPNPHQDLDCHQILSVISVFKTLGFDKGEFLAVVCNITGHYCLTFHLTNLIMNFLLPRFSCEVHVIQSLVLCVLFCCGSLFVPLYFSFGHCIVSLSSIYGFWLQLPLLCVQTR